MNRDAFIATLIGFAVGLVITGVILFSPAIAKFLPGVTLPAITFPRITLPALSSLMGKPAVSPTPTPPPQLLTIDAPLPDSIEPNVKTVVSGSAVAGSLVVIGGNTDESVSQVTAEGKYAGEITLSEGENRITVTMISDSQDMTQTLTVFYTPEEL